MPWLLLLGLLVLMARQLDVKGEEMSESRLDFIKRIRDLLSAADLSDIPGGPPRQRMRDAFLAQFVLETGGGQGDIYLHTHNLGSIKSTAGWTGKPSYKSTRVYSSDAEGLADYLRLMRTPLYAAAWQKAKVGDVSGFYAELERIGYEVAQDPPYSARLLRTYREIVA